MKQAAYLILLILFIHKCFGQKGFPEQFQATLNISGLNSWQVSRQGVQQLLYDYKNSRIRFDVKGWRLKQNETYMVIYKPEDAEANSVRRK